ncbi:MAG TPA: choice-of-anchor tandem repeat GloVer-containing protein [Terriglobales bacterium]|nr:choice-of-anchor tandem repeat GloVer-containing protein [Terriglobales bacterium]
MRDLGWWKKAGAVLVICVSTGIVVRAQTFNTLVTFDGPNGALPAYGALVQGRDGALYGTTQGGGSGPGDGTVFSVASDGRPTTLYSFCVSGICTDGAQPLAGLLQARDGNFYGTTITGIENGQTTYGTVFKITPAGYLTTLHVFDSINNGIYPLGTLIQATDGDLYGTTGGGGTDDCSDSCGTIFKMTLQGVLTTVHVFDYSDGDQPIAGLIQAVDGNFYGTTNNGGNSTNCAAGCGTIFKMSAAGDLTTLHSFANTDGSNPQGRLVQAANGNFYGTTRAGGNPGCNFGCGTVFRITPAGLLTTVYKFCTQSNCVDGGSPIAGLVIATNGNIYGTTSIGGSNNLGTIFTITSRGEFATLHSFSSSDGSNPWGVMAQRTNGTLYGTTNEGGAGFGYCSAGCGTVFSLDMGLGPFVAFVQGAGKVGQTGGILGQGFTGTTSVSLNGIPASFTVVSDTFIKATVPAGAMTGYVTVNTPSGVLTSNVPFQVIK